MAKRLYLVCYDINDKLTQDTFRKRVKDYAIDGQKSAYECWLQNKDKQSLMEFCHEFYDKDGGSDGFCIIKSYGVYWRNTQKNNPLHKPNDYLIYIG